MAVALRRLPAEEPPVRRFVRRLWLPYHRELEAIVENHELADDADLVEAEVPFRLDRLDSEDYRAWVAVDGDGTDTASEASPLVTTDSDLVGFVTTDVDGSPSVFDRPDRLVVGDVYVREEYRGTGLAAELVERATERAREVDCDELALDVDADNERALAFYEKLGFETHRYRMRVGVNDLSLES